MAKTLEYDKASFLHWEGDPNHSRERLTPTKAVKAGDLLVLTASGYDVYSGTKLTPKANAKADEYVVAVALEAGKANEPVPCVVRNAVLIQDRINNVATDAFTTGKPLENLLPHFAAQMLTVRLSVDAPKA